MVRNVAHWTQRIVCVFVCFSLAMGRNMENKRENLNTVQSDKVTLMGVKGDKLTLLPTATSGYGSTSGNGATSSYGPTRRYRLTSAYGSNSESTNGFGSTSGYGSTSGFKSVDKGSTPPLHTSNGLKRRRLTEMKKRLAEEKTEEVMMSDEGVPFSIVTLSVSNATVTDCSNATNNETEKGSNTCEEWKGGQSTLFQIGNLLYLCAFLIPHSFRASDLIMRACLTGGVTLFTAWALVHLCAVDMFLWCLTLLIVNLFHTTRLAYKLWPARITPDVLEFYEKLFKPLKVSRSTFALLMKEGKIEHMKAGDSYSFEDITRAGEKLAFLLSGRMTVSCEDTHIHYVFPNQFVDSVEWEAANNKAADDAEHLYQVSIMADEESKLYVWPRNKLKTLFEEEFALCHIVNCLIGKDITTKLYSLTEQVNHSAGSLSSRTSSIPMLLPGDTSVPARSVSADAVNTGNRGLVRSNDWRNSNKKSFRGQSPIHQPRTASPSYFCSRASPNIPRHSSNLDFNPGYTKETRPYDYQVLQVHAPRTHSPLRQFTTRDNSPLRVPSSYRNSPNRSFSNLENAKDFRTVPSHALLSSRSSSPNRKLLNSDMRATLNRSISSIGETKEEEETVSVENERIEEFREEPIMPKKRSSVVRCVGNPLHDFNPDDVSKLTTFASSPQLDHTNENLACLSRKYSKSLYFDSTIVLDDPSLLETAV